MQLVRNLLKSFILILIAFYHNSLGSSLLQQQGMADIIKNKEESLEDIWIEIYICFREAWFYVPATTSTQLYGSHHRREKNIYKAIQYPHLQFVSIMFVWHKQIK